MNFSERIKKIEECNSSNIKILVNISGLDPAKDFRYTNLKFMNFRDSDLTGFDFRGSDIHGANFYNAKIDGAIFDDSQKILLPALMSEVISNITIRPWFEYGVINKYNTEISELKENLSKYMPRINEMRGSDGYTALLEFCKNRRLTEIKLLVKAGADVNLGSAYDSTTPLMIAVIHGRFDLVQYLIHQRADVNKTKRDGVTNALLLGILKHRDKEVEYLVKHGAKLETLALKQLDKSRLHNAILENCTNIAEVLVDENIHIDYQSKYFGERSPIHPKLQESLNAACRSGDLKMLKIMNKLNLPFESKYYNEDTSALYIASERGHVDIVRLLLKNGANNDYVHPVTQKNSIEVATERHHWEVVQAIESSLGLLRHL